MLKQSTELSDSARPSAYVTDLPITKIGDRHQDRRSTIGVLYHRVLQGTFRQHLASTSSWL